MIDYHTLFFVNESRSLENKSGLELDLSPNPLTTHLVPKVAAASTPAAQAMTAA